MPGAPEPVWSSAKKAIDKDRMVVRIPLQKGGGEIFFGKKIYDGNLEVKFYRQVGTFDPINKNFTGYYETIDMNNFAYLKVDYINGIKVKEFRSRSMNVSNNNQSSVTTMGDSPPQFYGTWLAALWFCIKHYIIAVPVQNGKGWDCYGIGGGGGGGTPAEVEDPNPDEDGGSVIPPNFFTPTYPLPPSLWNPFPINNPPNGAPSSGSSLGNVSEKQKKDYLIQQLNLSPSQIEYIYQNTDLALALFNYLSFDNSPTKKEIAIWAIEYFRFNPLTQLKEFENQFLGISEGYDSEYDELFWQDPNNIFAHQQLPSWIDFESAYPKNDKGENMKAEEVFNKIGGDVKDGRDRSLVDPNQTPWNNACALRLSWALNKCDIKIPYIKGQTLKGGDGKYYFLGARNMNMWMRKTFGCSNPNRSLGEFYNPQAHHYDQSKVGKFGVGLEKELKDGKFNGIYTIVTNSKFASGHCDLLFSNATCLLSCHFADAAVYIEYCDIWNLK